MNAVGEMWVYLNTHDQEDMIRTRIIKLLEAIDREQQAAIAAAVTLAPPSGGVFVSASAWRGGLTSVV